MLQELIGTWVCRTSTASESGVYILFCSQCYNCVREQQVVFPQWQLLPYVAEGKRVLWKTTLE